MVLFVQLSLFSRFNLMRVTVHHQPNHCDSTEKDKKSRTDQCYCLLSDPNVSRHHRYDRFKKSRLGYWVWGVWHLWSQRRERHILDEFLLLEKVLVILQSRLLECLQRAHICHFKEGNRATRSLEIYCAFQEHKVPPFLSAHTQHQE